MSKSKSKSVGTVAITLIVIGLCVFVGFLAWGPNMKADYIGIGVLGVVLPIMAVVAAFIFGIGTGLTMDVGPDMDQIEL